MLAFLGFATIAAFLAVTLFGRTSVLVGLVLIPLAAGLLGGFGRVSLTCRREHRSTSSRPIRGCSSNLYVWHYQFTHRQKPGTLSAQKTLSDAVTAIDCFAVAATFCVAQRALRPGCCRCVML